MRERLLGILGTMSPDWLRREDTVYDTRDEILPRIWKESVGGIGTFIDTSWAEDTDTTNSSHRTCTVGEMWNNYRS
ncbi:hypothetical protein KIN20_015156 [Parelaphostrongylus tenuis]|uniref:Uncharacterized protein n=1 Tax=Parelaphostrongylus tenuis TaxID=148309 RepID=A0AAD5MZX6_PARTN|nr:hypothetical protein KIN20_015156 [Parelaphostrongylus tenuis]